MDLSSEMGRFGWCQVGRSAWLPVIYRSSTVYVSVRVAEQCLKFAPGSLATVDTVGMTEAEARLMTQINITHCDGVFGLELFSISDQLVKLRDLVANDEICVSEGVETIRRGLNEMVMVNGSHDSGTGNWQ